MSIGSPVRVTVWCENVQDRADGLGHLHPRNPDPAAQSAYPAGMHEAIAQGLVDVLGEKVEVKTATLHDPEHGLSQDVLDTTDVLTWWGHVAHDDVDSAVVARVHDRVLNGMGLIVLHSAHYSKIFLQLMGTSCDLYWRDDDEEELVWTVAPGHPIAEGIPHPIVIEAQEMYGEHFDIPAPDELIFVSSFHGGEIFRSGCCYLRGRGRVFYFSPGHETAPIYSHRDVQRVIANGVMWAAASPGPAQKRENGCPYVAEDWFRQISEAKRDPRASLVAGGSGLHVEARLHAPLAIVLVVDQ
jgi:trehalose utilization protein